MNEGAIPVQDIHRRVNRPASPPFGLIFDFDGVIALSEPVHAGAWADMAAHYGRELPEGFIESGIGSTDRLLSFQLAGHWALRMEGAIPDGESVLEAKRRYYRERARREACLVPGVIDALRRYHGRVPMAVATSSSRADIEPYFDRDGLHEFFDVVLTLESVSSPKPHPEIYLAAAERIGLRPEQCVVFEDSLQGVRAARAARTRLIALTTTFSLEALSPVDAHMSDFTNLEFLQKQLDRFSNLVGD